MRGQKGGTARDMKTADPVEGDEHVPARRLIGSEQELKLARELALAIGEAETLEGALQVLLRTICEATGWQLGEAWIRTNSHLRCSPAWYAARPGLEPFREGWERWTVSPGYGLPGQAWAAKRPVWMRDVSSDPRFVRKVQAKAVGPKAGVAVPVLSEDDVVAVLVFFVFETREEDEALIDLVSTIGAQLGALIRRRQVEEALRRSDEQLRAIAETAVDAIISADSTGSITYFNRSAERIFGYSWNEVVGRPLTVLMPERYRAAHEQGLRRFLATGEGNLIGKTLELAGRVKDGREFPLELALSTWSVDGNTFFTAVLRDISGRKEAEEVLRQSDLMKTTVLRSVSHDFRSPLTAIVTAGELVASPELDTKARDELASVIVGQASRLSALVDKLLDLSRLQGGAAAPRKVSCSMAEILEAALDQFLGEDSDFELALHPELPSVRVDAAQLERALANLFENARRHSNGQPVRVSAVPAHGKLEVRVTDRGPGIPEEDRERVFEPFYRAEGDTRHGGSGLGLAIVKGFVEANGGRVWVELPRDGGTTFVVELPLQGEQPVASGEERG